MPLYKQIADHLGERVAAGEFPTGALPASPVLAKEYGVSGGTVTHAFSWVDVDGYVVKTISGQGGFLVKQREVTADDLRKVSDRLRHQLDELITKLMDAEQTARSLGDGGYEIREADRHDLTHAIGDALYGLRAAERINDCFLSAAEQQSAGLPGHDRRRVTA